MSVALESLPQPSTEIERIPGIVSDLRKTFESGRTRDYTWRRAQIEGLKAMMVERGDEFTAALHADFGKPEFEAWAVDVGAVKMEAVLALKKLKKWMRPERVGLLPIPGRMRVIREPLGVVLIISPWNYPVQLLLCPLVGAVAAGNCAVLKPSEITAHTSALLAKWVPEYLDPQAITLVEGAVDETTALLEQRWDHIFYTGNGTVGRIVMRAAAEHLTPVTLELGGKSPCIVDRDVDIEITARRIAWGKFLNAGQTCVAPDYVLVHRDREQELVDALGKAVREFYGDDPAATPDYARISSSRHHARLAAMLDEGDAAVGGKSDPAQRYIAPTVLRNVSPGAKAMQEEIFGPILPVLPVSGIDEAVEYVNKGEKPLALYLFSNDSATEQDVLDRTTSGGVCVNGTILHLSNAKLPFGGVGASGMGAYHGRHSFETFSHRRSVLTRDMRFDPKLMYPPYSERKTRMAKKFM